ncbi:MAG: hypothetical protein ABJN84_08935 [Flavobacteriaceae bacterium]
MLRRRREQKLKYWLGLILKVLLILLALVKLLDWKPWNKIGGQTNGTEEVTEQNATVDSPTRAISHKVETTTKDVQKEETKRTPIENSASIYIFSENGLDSQMVNQLGKSYFKGYAQKSGAGFQKEQLLSGNLSSAVNTELVCVGTVSYNFFKNSMQQITCQIELNFDTYNTITGNRVTDLSESKIFSGPGDTNAWAKSVALRKVHP